MSALRYYEFPTTEPKASGSRGLIDNFCARLWAWAADGHFRAKHDHTELTDPHLRRDIGLDGDADTNWM